MSMMQEFKEFAMKGNVIDLAVGVLLGAAFGKIVDAFTAGIITPIINAIGGNPDISLKIGVLDIGLVINAIISFLITALVLFFVFVKPMNRLMKATEKK
jgi:large conductance mechanosensitive channel